MATPIVCAWDRPRTRTPRRACGWVVRGPVLLPVLLLAAACAACCGAAQGATAQPAMAPHSVRTARDASNVQVVRPLATEAASAGPVLSHGPEAAGCVARAADVRACTAAVAAKRDGGDTVIAYAQQLVRDVPRCADAWQCLGAALYGTGRLAEATLAFEKTVALAPTASHYRSNLGLVLYHQNRVEDAITHFRVSAALDPSVAVSQLMIGASLFELRRYPEAIDHYQHVLASALPLSLDAEARMRCSLVFGLQSMGRMHEASRTLEEAMGRIPALRVRHAVTQVPVVPASEEDIVHWRRVTERAVRSVVAELEAGTLVIDGTVNPLDMGGDLGYWLTYQGFNDEPLRRDITRMYARAYPVLSYTSPRLAAGTWDADAPVMRGATTATPAVLSRRIRVGFVSDHLSEHSVGKMITRLIAFLPRAMFHVTVLRFLGGTGWVRRAIDNAADAIVQLPESQSLSSITESHALIDACQLDVLVFPELGMHLQTYLLAFGRYAPVQVVTHGNSMTSGLADTVDYFMSLDPAEPDVGVTHYSEQLVRLQTHHSAFLAPVPTQVDRDSALQAYAAVQSVAEPGSDKVDAVALLAARFGAWRGVARAVSVVDASVLATVTALPITAPAQCEAGAIYLCPQTLYKMHPSFDAVLLRILELDPCGHLVLIEGTNRAWDDAVVSRLVAAAAVRYSREGTPGLSQQALSVVSRLLLVPQQRHPDFLTLLAFADSIVDTHPFGGCTTTYEALAVGTPVVSWPGSALRGRFTKALLERAGLRQCVVASAEALAVTSVQIANATAHATPQDRRQQRRDISAAAKEMFEDGQAVQGWSDFLVRAVKLASLR